MACPFAFLEPLFQNRAVVTVACLAAGAAVGKTVWDAVRQQRHASKEAARKAKYNAPGVVYLYQFPRSERLGSLSTFCTIVETYLRLTGTKHEVVDVVDASMSPTGRLPYIELDGKGTADSEFIMERLARDLGHRAVPAGHVDQAVSTMLVRTLNHSIRLHMARHLWVDNTGAMRAEFTSAGKPFGTPALVVSLLCRKARQSSISLLNAEGQGDLSDVEYHAKYLADVRAVEGALEGFAEGKLQLSQAAIATAFTYLSYIVVVSPDCPAVRHAKKSATIKNFLHRIDHQAYPDAKTRLPLRPAFESA